MGLPLNHGFHRILFYGVLSLQLIMFIAIEGIDGSGKSTLASSIEKVLSSLNYRVYRTYEPTDKFIENQAILEKSGRDEPLLLLSLFLKDRIEHSNEIKRQLDMGNIVICDRYSLSTFAYQGALLRNNLWQDVRENETFILLNQINVAFYTIHSTFKNHVSGQAGITYVVTF